MGLKLEEQGMPFDGKRHARLGPSSSDIWLTCLGAPHEWTKYPPKGVGFAAHEGTLAHTLCEAALTLNAVPWKEGAIFEVEGDQVEITQEMLNSVSLFATTMSIISDMSLWRMIEDEVSLGWLWNGAKPPEEVFGTADFAACDGFTLYVCDFKFGRGKAVRVERNTQLLVLRGWRPGTTSTRAPGPRRHHRERLPGDRATSRRGRPGAPVDDLGRRAFLLGARRARSPPSSGSFGRRADLGSGASLLLVRRVARMPGLPKTQTTALDCELSRLGRRRRRSCVMAMKFRTEMLGSLNAAFDYRDRRTQVWRPPDDPTDTDTKDFVMATTAILTPPGIASFLNLQKARPVVVGGEPRFSLTLIFDKAAQARPEFKALQQAIDAALKERWPGKLPVGLRSPFHDGAEKTVSTTATRRGICSSRPGRRTSRAQSTRAKKTSSTGPSSGPVGRRGPTCGPSPTTRAATRAAGCSSTASSSSSRASASMAARPRPRASPTTPTPKRWSERSPKARAVRRPCLLSRRTRQP